MKKIFLTVVLLSFVFISYSQRGLGNLRSENSNNQFEEKYQEAVSSLKNNNPAWNLVRELERNYPENVKVRMLVGWATFVSGRRVHEAFEPLSTYLIEFPEDTLIHRIRAYTGLKCLENVRERDINHFQPTLSSFELILSFNNSKEKRLDMARVLYYGGHLYFENKDFDNALVNFNKSMEIITNYELEHGRTDITNRYSTRNKTRVSEIEEILTRYSNVKRFVEEFKANLENILPAVTANETDIAIHLRTIEVALNNKDYDNLKAGMSTNPNIALNSLGNILFNSEEPLFDKYFAPDTKSLFPFFRRN